MLRGPTPGCTTASWQLPTASQVSRRGGTRAILEAFLTERWYSRPGVLLLLWPFEWLYGRVADWRRERANQALAQSTNPHIPTIVVGNLVAGGTGKTPMVVEVVRELMAQGVRPGIVTRGYGGRAGCWPRLVSATGNTDLCGDEACELASITGCPVVAGPDRAAAARWLVELLGCQVVVSDDGLQHYGLARDLEMILVDAERGFGNGHRLPVGPLRELPARLRQADVLILTSGGSQADTAKGQELVSVTDQACDAPVLKASLVPDRARLLLDPNAQNSQPVADAPFAGQAVTALSSIGYPRRFHADLAQLGCELTTRALADHQTYAGFRPDWPPQNWVVTTGKDAAKLRWRLRADSTFGATVGSWLDRVWVLERRVDFAHTGREQFSRVLAGFVANLSPGARLPQALPVNGAETTPHSNQLTDEEGSRP